MDFLEYSTFICSNYQLYGTFYEWDSDKYSDRGGTDKKLANGQIGRLNFKLA